jgi:hypothetical protein
MMTDRDALFIGVLLYDNGPFSDDVLPERVTNAT